MLPGGCRLNKGEPDGARRKGEPDGARCKGEPDGARRKGEPDGARFRHARLGIPLRGRSTDP